MSDPRNIFQELPEVVHGGTTSRYQLLTESKLSLGKVATYNYAWVEPGSEMEPHQHPDCVEYYLFLVGQAEILRGANWSPVKPGDFVTIESETQHSVRNRNSEKCTFMVLRTHQLT